MSSQQTFTRKEVRELLKKQKQASIESYNRLGVHQFLIRLSFNLYMDEVERTTKRLKEVNIIKF